MNSSDWVLDTDGKLSTVETPQADSKFLVVVLESPQTRFFSGPPDDPTSIHKSGSKFDGSKDCPHISSSTGYYRSPEIFLKNHHSIQENNNLQNKMNERTYHEVLSTVVHELLHPFLAVLTLHMRLYK
jgi:hypothetical protein